MSADPHLTEAEQALLEVEVARVLHQGSEARAAMGRALAAAERAIAADADLAPAHRIRAVALLELGRPKEAVRSALAAIRLAPGTADPHALLARALAETGDVHRAIAAAGEAVRLEPEAAAGWYAQGLLAHRGGQWDVAEGNLRRVLAIEPEHVQAQRLLDDTVRRRLPSSPGASSPARSGPGMRRILPWWRLSVYGAVGFLVLAFALSALLR